MADWDDEGFEPGELEQKKGDTWEGEDEDDDELKENWDDEEENETAETEANAASAAVMTRKKKSTVKKKILEKEEKMQEEVLKRMEMREKQRDENDDDDEESIIASKLGEKIKNQKLVEEADFQVAKDLFGERNTEGATRSIDTFIPTNQDEFNELAKMLAEKLSRFETSVEYPVFLEVLLRDLASGMAAEDVKKLGSTLNVLASEKQKAQKVKKKPKKAVLGGSNKGAKGVDLHDYSSYGDEYEDFM